jgi:hypothetical protein
MPLESRQFPITVKDFLDETEFHLKRGDIILSRSPNFFSWLIRKTTGSAFSHAALVYLVAQPEKGYRSSFLLESTSLGVGIANFKSYIDGRNPAAEIAILRFDDPALDEQFFRHVRGLLLDQIKSSYDYGKAIRLALKAIFGLRLGYANWRVGASRSMQDVLARTQTRMKKWVPKEYICSGYIQYGLVRAAIDLGIDPAKVLFRDDLTAHSGDALLAVTPEDVALSPKMQWRLVARRGWVHEARNRQDALRIISGGR